MAKLISLATGSTLREYQPPQAFVQLAFPGSTNRPRTDSACSRRVSTSAKALRTLSAPEPWVWDAALTRAPRARRLNASPRGEPFEGDGISQRRYGVTQPTGLPAKVCQCCRGARQPGHIAKLPLQIERCGQVCPRHLGLTPLQLEPSDSFPDTRQFLVLSEPLIGVLRRLGMLQTDRIGRRSHTAVQISCVIARHLSTGRPARQDHLQDTH